MNYEPQREAGKGRAFEKELEDRWQAKLKARKIRLAE